MPPRLGPPSWPAQEGRFPPWKTSPRANSPNGVAILPVPGTKQAEHGVVLKFSTGTFAEFPLTENGRVLRTTDALQSLRAAKTADLLSLPDAQGSLWAVSGRISELGTSYLSAAAARKLDIPMEIPGTSRSPAGMFPGVSEGRTYLVQTTDTHYALVRVLEKSPTGLVVQYIYQPASMLSFDVPKADLVDYRHPLSADDVPAAAATAPDRTAPAAAVLAESAARTPSVLPPPAPRPVLGPDDRFEPGVIVLRATAPEVPKPSGVETSPDAFSRQARPDDPALHGHRDRAGRSPAPISRKRPRPFSNWPPIFMPTKPPTFSSARSLSLTPAAPRVNSRRIRRFPASPPSAAWASLRPPPKLRGLKQLNMDEPGDAIDTPKYRADLLGAVIRSVEGDDVANFIFHREMEKETDPKKRAVFEYLLSKN